MVLGGRSSRDRVINNNRPGGQHHRSQQVVKNILRSGTRTVPPNKYSIVDSRLMVRWGPPDRWAGAKPAAYLFMAGARISKLETYYEKPTIIAHELNAKLQNCKTAKLQNCKTALKIELVSAASSHGGF